jgi:hypothetical protein
LFLPLFTEGRTAQGLAGNIVVITSSPIYDVWQDANLEVDLPIVKPYLSWFPGIDGTTCMRFSMGKRLRPSLVNLARVF